MPCWATGPMLFISSSQECKSETAMFAFAPWHWVMSLAKTLLQYCFKSLQYFRVVSKSSRSQKRSSHIFPPSLDRNSWVFGWWFEICLCSMLTSMMIRLVDVCAWNGPTRFGAERPQCLTHRSWTEYRSKTVLAQSIHFCRWLTNLTIHLHSWSGWSQMVRWFV